MVTYIADSLYQSGFLGSERKKGVPGTGVFLALA